MGWKLFALLMAVLTGWSFADSDSYTSTGLVHLTMSALSAVGLVLMAFQIDFLPRKFCRANSGAHLLPHMQYIALA